MIQKPIEHSRKTADEAESGKLMGKEKKTDKKGVTSFAPYSCLRLFKPQIIQACGEFVFLLFPFVCFGRQPNCCFSFLYCFQTLVQKQTDLTLRKNYVCIFFMYFKNVDTFLCFTVGK